MQEVSDLLLVVLALNHLDDADPSVNCEKALPNAFAMRGIIHSALFHRVLGESEGGERRLRPRWDGREKGEGG